MKEKSIEEIFGECIFSYTSKAAEEDGVLFDITRLNESWKKGVFNYVTTNLLSRGYINEGSSAADFRKSINLPNLLDLLNQANQIIKRKSNNFENFDTFFQGEIELPSGEKQPIFIEQNETGKFTILLPEDH